MQEHMDRRAVLLYYFTRLLARCFASRMGTSSKMFLDQAGTSDPLSSGISGSLFYGHIAVT